MKKLEPTVLSVLVALATIPAPSCAQEDGISPGYKHDVQITGKSGGPYNVKASVKPQTEVVPMGLANKKSGTNASAQSDKDKSPGLRNLERILFGSASDDLPILDPTTTAALNDFVNSKDPPASSQTTKPTTSPLAAASSAMDPEAHHHQQAGGGPEDHHHTLPTDGSPGADDITNGAITTFYDNLPSDVVDRLSGMGVDPLATVHAAGDPYAPYAIALNRGDFNSMRRYAMDDAVDNLRQRIAMLGLAGASALRNLANPKNTDTFPAKDTLRKIAEDLHYAGQGLDENKPGEARLKATCEDISRIWSNMTQPKTNK
ncbi:MAG: hypothetical protein K2Y22_11010 [Candidatus Obscuribacterales bacterium]|nr:hypothetical protein [Candidatus Obscuribacterales bacterium]